MRQIVIVRACSKLGRPFWRGGIQWPAEPQTRDVSRDALSDEQFDRIVAEPALRVFLIDDAPNDGEPQPGDVQTGNGSAAADAQAEAASQGAASASTMRAPEEHSEPPGDAANSAAASPGHLPLIAGVEMPAAAPKAKAKAKAKR